MAAHPIQDAHPPADRVLLKAFRKNRSIERFAPFVDLYLPLVYASARRQSADPAAAAEIARAVFVALAGRVRSLSRRSVLAGWLFRATRYAAKKVGRGFSGAGPAGNLAREAGSLPDHSPAPDAGPVAAQAAPAPPLLSPGPAPAGTGPSLDKALARLSRKHQDALLTRFVMNRSELDAARNLRVRPKRLARRARKALGKMARHLGRPKTAGDLLAGELIASRWAVPVPAGLAEEILRSASRCLGKRPDLVLARGVLRAVTWAKWRRLLGRLAATAGALALIAVLLVFSTKMLWRSGRLLPVIVALASRLQSRNNPELVAPARPWPANRAAALRDATTVHGLADLYQITNIWLAHLQFTAEQWDAMTPSHVPPVPEIMRPDGTVVLRNPLAKRSGVAGALGFDFNWVHADLEFSGVRFNNVAARYRGNGTYLNSLFGPKRSVKVDLNKFDKRQELAGVRTLNLANLVEDRSYMSDALGYELFRDAGVPSPRTAYAWMTLTVPGQYERTPIGLYLLLENVDAVFAAERFGSSKTPIFKPVTPELFKFLGEDWAAYADIYDLKTKATKDQKQRLIDFARLVTFADDSEFARRLGEFLDLDEFARYLAALVLIANYDSLLTYGQNYYLYLDPLTAKFGFIPWDLDQAWGSFPQFGTSMSRERASIWHPWVGKNRFLQRVMAVDEFHQLYRKRLEIALNETFVPERLSKRIDQVAPVLRSAVAAESSFRLRLFDQAISTNWLNTPRDGGEGPNRPVHQLKRFIVNRAASVRAQLDGKSKGIVLERGEN